MATHTADRAKHATLTADAVDTVTLSARWRNVEIFNRSTAGVVYFSADGSSPTVAGDDAYVVGPGSAVTVATQWTSTVVKLISATADAYSVTGF